MQCGEKGEELEMKFLGRVREVRINLCEMLEARDRSMKTALESRDIGWLNSLQDCKDSLRLTTQKLINNRCTLE